MRLRHSEIMAPGAHREVRGGSPDKVQAGGLAAPVESGQTPTSDAVKAPGTLMETPVMPSDWKSPMMSYPLGFQSGEYQKKESAPAGSGQTMLKSGR
jgi:hypothetical protein